MTAIRQCRCPLRPQCRSQRTRRPQTTAFNVNRISLASSASNLLLCPLHRLHSPILLLCVLVLWRLTASTRVLQHSQHRHR
eukprot:766636-Hanusia_phi.AAC.3